MARARTATPRTRVPRRLAPLRMADRTVLAQDAYGNPTLLSGLPDDPMLADAIAAQPWPRARHALRVRLQRKDNPVVSEICRGLTDELVMSIGLKVAGGVASVRPESLAEWPIDEDGAFAKGLENLAGDTRRMRIGHVELAAPPGRWDGLRITLTCVDGLSAAHSGRALMLDQQLTDAAPHGRLVAVPNRLVLWAHTITDDSAEAAAEAMGMLAREDFRTGQGPLSPEVFFVPPVSDILRPVWHTVHSPAFLALLATLPAAA